MEDLANISEAFHDEAPEHRLVVRSVGGKKRLLTIPNESLKELHRTLTQRLRKIESRVDRDEYIPHPNSYGVWGGNSAIENAAAHAKNRHVFQLDIRNAYGSMPLDRLAMVLYRLDFHLGTEDTIFDFLREHCVGFTGLGTGFPASPLLFDLYCCTNIDPVLRSRFPDLTYTRYIDDLTFSSARPITSGMRKIIRRTLAVAGFQVHPGKTRLTDRAHRNVTITGATLTSRGHIRPTDAFLARLYEAIQKKPEENTTRDAYVLTGMMGQVGSMMYLRPHVPLAPEALVLWKRAQRRHRQLTKLGFFQAERVTPKRLSLKYLNRLRASIPMSEVVTLLVDGDRVIKPIGKDLVMRCVYHHERTPSFTISDEKMFYHCFGCGSHGDIIQIVMDMKKLGFREAVWFLVDHFGAPKSRK